MVFISVHTNHPTTIHMHNDTMKPSDPLLLTDVSLHCRMYPLGKISRHLADL